MPAALPGPVGVVGIDRAEVADGDGDALVGGLDELDAEILR